MTERELDELLYQSAGQLPADGPDSLPPAPWRRALKLICWGMALTTITLNFLLLQYILPTVGAVLLCLGFRSLRRENRWFRFAYALSILLALYRGVLDVLLATPVFAAHSALSYLSGLAGWLMNLALFFSLWRGLKEVFLRAGLPAKTGAAGGMVICYFLLFLLALVNASGWLLLLPVLILWICLLVGLFKTSRALDQAGYAITPAPVRLSNGKVLIVSLGAVLLAVLACLLIFSRYPVEAAPAQAETGQAELRRELLGLGFPEEVLADLTDEEVALLEGVEHIQVQDHSSGSRPDDPEVYNIYGYFIQVELPEDMARYFFWFSWDEGPNHRLRESLEILPDWTYDAILRPDELQGRLLWEEDGQLYQALLLGQYGNQTQSSIFFGTSSYQSFSVNFSLPRRGEHIRGYVTYEARIQTPKLATNYNAGAFYVRQEKWFSYPWESPLQHQRKGWNNNDEFFPARQFLVMFTLNEDLLPD